MKFLRSIRKVNEEEYKIVLIIRTAYDKTIRKNEELMVIIQGLDEQFDERKGFIYFDKWHRKRKFLLR